jgi:hypothetical protein
LLARDVTVVVLSVYIRFRTSHDSGTTSPYSSLTFNISSASQRSLS